MEDIILLIIIAACVGIIVISLVKNRADILANFMLRIVIGIMVIYLLNIFIEYAGYSVKVGINFLTIMANGILGMPGLIMIYLIAIYLRNK